MYREEQDRGDLSGDWDEGDDRQMLLAVDFHRQSMYERVFRVLLPSNMPRRVDVY